MNYLWQFRTPPSSDLSDDSGVQHSVSTADDRWLPFAAAEAEALEKAFCDPTQSLFQRYIDFEYFKFYLLFVVNVLSFNLLYS